MSQKIRAVIAAVMLLVSVIVGAAHWQQLNQALSERPQEAVIETVLPSTPSNVAAGVVIPYEPIANMANKKIPVEMPINGWDTASFNVSEQVEQTFTERVGGDLGRLLGQVFGTVTRIVTLNRPIKQDYHYNVTLRRGTISVSQSGGKLHLELPISFSGSAGFPGDIAKAVRLNKKNFRGTIQASADVSISMGADWRPVLNPVVSYRWIDRGELEVAGKFWINIQDTLEPQLDTAIKDGIREVQNMLDSGQIKKAVAQNWHPYSMPIEVKGLKVSYLNIVPKSVGLSAILAESDGLHFNFNLSTVTDLSTSPVSVSEHASELPPLSPVATANWFTIVAPVRASYAELRQGALTLLANRAHDLPTGNGTIEITDLTIYPTKNKQVAVGVKIDVTTKHHFMNTKGWVYFTATPVWDAASKTLSLVDLHLTRQLDNPIWNAITAVVQGPVQQVLEASLVRDLSGDIASAQELLKTQMTTLAKGHGIEVRLAQDKLDLRELHLAGDAVELVIGFDGYADIEIKDIDSLLTV